MGISIRKGVGKHHERQLVRGCVGGSYLKEVGEYRASRRKH